MKSFKIISGKAVLSDPHYELGAWCQAIIDNVKNGVWEAEVEYLKDDPKTIARLYVYNCDEVIENSDVYHEIFNEDAAPLPFALGVDSGRLGIFDFDNYPKDRTATKEQYKADWVTTEFGVISKSGRGDNSYIAIGIKNDADEYVAFSIRFISEEKDTMDDWNTDDEDEDEDESDEN